MKIEDLTENDVIHIRNKKEAKGIKALLQNKGIGYWQNDLKLNIERVLGSGCISVYDGSFTYLLSGQEEGKNIIPASKFLKPSLKKRFNSLCKEFEETNKKLNELWEAHHTSTALKSKIDIVHFDEAEKLPEKWCVFGDEQELVDYANKYGVYKGRYNSVKKHYYHFPAVDNNSATTSRVLEDGYTEISFETFKRLVLKEDEKPLGFETGKWYKYPDTSFLMCVRNYDHEDKSASGYGINSTGEWFDSVIDVEGLIPATDEEVNEALIKEAERRGFKDGVVFYGLIRTKDKINKTGNISFEFCAKTNELRMFSNKFETLNDNYVINHRGYSSIFINGKWAEIISEPETIDFSKAGQLVKSDDVIVFTTGEHNGSMFSGYALTTFERGQFENDWDKELFTLCTEPVTLSN